RYLPCPVCLTLQQKQEAAGILPGLDCVLIFGRPLNIACAACVCEFFATAYFIKFLNEPGNGRFGCALLPPISFDLSRSSDSWTAMSRHENCIFGEGRENAILVIREPRRAVTFKNCPHCAGISCGEPRTIFRVRTATKDQANSQ